ncbi:hypothetical protein Btru_039810 [Bulinus truncatus]|nr:hypothetical protein Btru_039810 [Bulinus truncatus]
MFLLLQREGRKGFMSSVDSELYKKEQRILDRKKTNKEKESKELKRKEEATCSTVSDLVLTESDSSQGTDNEVDDFNPLSAKKLKLKKRFVRIHKLSVNGLCYTSRPKYHYLAYEVAKATQNKSVWLKTG